MTAAVREAGHDIRLPFNPIRRIQERISAWMDARRLACELSGMSDRDLSDIGLNRGDVQTVLAGRWNASGSKRG